MQNFELAKMLREHAIPIVLVLSLALLSAQLSVQLRSDGLTVVINEALRMFSGDVVRPDWQNRVLSPAMLIVLRKIFPADVSDKSVWFALRVLQAVMAYVVVYGVAYSLTGGRLRALAAVALVAFAYAWTPLTHARELTSDFFDIMFIALFVGLALAERSVILGVLVLIAAANRESAAFAGIIWLAVATVRYGPWPENWRKFVPGVIYIALAATVVIGLRAALSRDFHPTQELGIVDTIGRWNWMLHPDGAFPLFVCLVVAFLVLLSALPRPWTTDQKGLLLGAVGVAAISFTFGIVGELRVSLPWCVILSVLAVIGANERSDREWVQTLVSQR